MTQKNRSGKKELFVQRPGQDISLSFYKEIKKHDQLTAEEEDYYLRKSLQGDKEARRTLILCNLRLIIKYARQKAYTGIPTIDLIQEGVIGLDKAIGRFDLERGLRLSTFATWHIKGTMDTALSDQTRTIRLTLTEIKKIKKIQRATDSVMQSLGRIPTDNEISSAIDMSPCEIFKTKNFASSSIVVIPRKEKEIIYDYYQESESSISCTPNDHERIHQQNMVCHDLIKELLSNLKERQVYVLEKRYGLNGHEEETLDTIAEVLKLSRERVRQIQEQSIKELKAQVETNNLSLSDLLS